MFIKNVLLLAFMLVATSVANNGHAGQLPPFGYPPFETINIHANSNNKDYELYIQLPKSYRDTKKSYPLIIVNDTSFAFPRSYCGRYFLLKRR